MCKMGETIWRDMQDTVAIAKYFRPMMSGAIQDLD